MSAKQLLLASVGFRLLFLVSLPALSNDYYRFIWDGRLLANGINPFLFTPTEVLAQTNMMAQTGLTQILYAKLNSPDYYTVYPPIAQFFFGISAYISPAQSWLSHVVTLRLSILFAECITLFFAWKIIKQSNFNDRKILLYALNPLIIIEFTGNLHFEAWMVAGLAMCLYFWKEHRLELSAFGLAVAVLAKLLPLMLFPLFLRPFWFKKAFIFYGIAFLLMIGAFLPLINLQEAIHLFSSVRLYFQDFEFNASIYYLVREAGYWAVGYNIIATAGKILPAAVLLAILGISFFGKTPISHKMMLIFFIYLLGAHIVHPWYVGVLVFLGIFGNCRFPWVWSCAVVLSYDTYRTSAYTEDLRLVALEYAIVSVALLADWRGGRLNASQTAGFGSV